jgi:glycosyltransferase involved in cell wall biosynthesis
VNSVPIKTAVKRAIAVVALTIIYSLTTFISRLGRFVRRPRAAGKDGILLIGTFHNPNWVNAHLRPLAGATDGKVTLVCDEPVVDLEGVTYACPPKWISKLISRAGSKFIWGVYQSVKIRPVLVMGYHIFPAAVSALVAARLTGSFAGYQVTAGQLELEGGGWHAENALLTMLASPSAVVERAVLRCVREFDCTVVRGERARQYLVDNGYQRHIPIITGSVEFPSEHAAFSDRPYDLIFVGRLTEYKRPDRILRVIKKAKDAGAHLSVLMVGDGPDKEALLEMARELGIADLIEWAGQRKDVPELLQKAKVFVLTSRWEGVSIALLEAMAAGCVPVVSDVGDLRDFVDSDKNGWVLDEHDINGFAAAILESLSDEQEWHNLSNRARSLVLARASKDAIAKRWRRQILSFYGTDN